MLRSRSRESESLKRPESGVGVENLGEIGVGYFTPDSATMVTSDSGHDILYFVTFSFMSWCILLFPSYSAACMPKERPHINKATLFCFLDLTEYIPWFVISP